MSVDQLWFKTRQRFTNIRLTKGLFKKNASFLVFLSKTVLSFLVILVISIFRVFSLVMKWPWSYLTGLHQNKDFFPCHWNNESLLSCGTTENATNIVCVNLLCFLKTRELWSSKANWSLRFSLPSIILADLLGHRTLLKQVQKVIVCDLWLVNWNPFCVFVCFKVRCLWS